MTELNLQVDGMDCGGCEQSIQKAVQQIAGVEGVTADHQSGRVQVIFAAEPDEPAVRSAIEDAGFDVVGA